MRPYVKVKMIMNIKARSLAGFVGVGLVSLALTIVAGDMDKKGTTNKNKSMDTMMMEKDKMETKAMGEKMMDDNMETKAMNEKMMDDKMDIKAMDEKMMDDKIETNAMGEKMMEEKSMDHNMMKK